MSVGNLDKIKRKELMREDSLIIWRLKILILDINLSGLKEEFTKLEEAERVLELPFFKEDTVDIINAFLDELDSFGEAFHEEVKYES